MKKQTFEIEVVHATHCGEKFIAVRYENNNLDYRVQNIKSAGEHIRELVDTEKTICSISSTPEFEIVVHHGKSPTRYTALSDEEEQQLFEAIHRTHRTF